jgi:hypothetical protein
MGIGRQSSREKGGARMKSFKAGMRNIHRRAERGDVGGEYAFIVYSPFLIGVLMVGICFALIGFWRIGASYAAQRSAQVGAVNPGQAMTAQSAFLTDWTNASSAPAGGFGVNAPNRTATSSVNTRQAFEYLEFGEWTFEIGGQTMTRSERFYPGRPVCNADGCDE